MQKQYKEFPNTLYPESFTSCFHFAPFIMLILSFSFPTLLHSLRLFHTLCPPISKYLSMHLANSRTRDNRMIKLRKCDTDIILLSISPLIQILSIVLIMSFIAHLPLPGSMPGSRSVFRCRVPLVLFQLE